MLPTARTLAFLRKGEAFIAADIVERWVGPPNKPFMRKRKDLFGCIDIVVLEHGKQGLLGIQATSDQSSGNVSTRVRKIREECTAVARAWLQAGNRLQVWGWSKHKVSEKSVRWSPRIVTIKLNDLGELDAHVPDRRKAFRKHKPGSGLAAFAKDVKRQRKSKATSTQLPIAFIGSDSQTGEP